MYLHIDVQDRGVLQVQGKLNLNFPVLVAERNWHRLPPNLISSLKNRTTYSSNNVSYCTAT